MEGKNKRDYIASVGIGSMISFIAMMLVAAIASTALIMMFEKTFQNSANKADKMNSSGNAKVTISNIFIYRYEPCWQSTSTDPTCPFNWGHHQLIITFSIVGAYAPIPDTDIHWWVTCSETDDVVNPLETGTFDNHGGWAAKGATLINVLDPPLEVGQAVHLSNMKGDRASGAAANSLENGGSYGVMIDLYDNKNTATGIDDTGCRITTSYDTKLFIKVERGQLTQTELNFKSTEPATWVL